MTTLSDIKEILKNNKDRLSTKYGLSNIAIFGSYGRGQQTADSDIDILVDFKRPIGVEFIDLAEELEILLRTKVDLVSKNGVNPEYFKQIETDLYYVHWP
jgi:predicted nucleotidyltransferase